MDAEEKRRILEMKEKGELVGKLLGMDLRALDPNYSYGSSLWGIGSLTIPACAVDLICELHQKIGEQDGANQRAEKSS